MTGCPGRIEFRFPRSPTLSAELRGFGDHSMAARCRQPAQQLKLRARPQPCRRGPGLRCPGHADKGAGLALAPGIDALPGVIAPTKPSLRQPSPSCSALTSMTTAKILGARVRPATPCAP